MAENNLKCLNQSDGLTSFLGIKYIDRTKIFRNGFRSSSANLSRFIFFSTGSTRYAAHHTIHHINYYNSYNLVLNQERYHGGIIPIC